MAASLASAAALCPRPTAARRSRCRRCAPVRAESGLEPGGGREGNFISTQNVEVAFDEVWDEQAGQFVQSLTQSVQSAATPGLDWSYRLVEPHHHPSLVAAVSGHSSYSLPDLTEPRMLLTLATPPDAM